MNGTQSGIDTALNLVPGRYTYNVYESEVQSLDISLSTGVILQSGIMIVDDITNSYINQLIPNQNDDTSIYD